MATVYAYEKKAKRRSVLLTVLFAAGVLAILILAGFRPPFPPLEPEGLLIDFGFDESGSGKIESASRISAAPQAQNQPVEQKIETQDFQETVTLPEEKKKTDKPKTETKTDTKKDPEPVIDQGEVFNPNKHKFDSNSSSDGSSGGKGNEGHIDGNPNGYPGNGSGAGDNGTNGFGYDLSGRSMVSKPVIGGTPPESGKVVLKITVDRNGVVTTAVYERKGSTIVDQGVINEAIRSVKGKKLFNTSSDAPETQTGTLTINYTLK
ncbi:MAG: hypothetical protein H6548_05685 [Chitinophagales bacterium]|nr:hypothetical protein [Chitinophagales bacterium]HAE13891.1 hypothetical protein [Bacteroidota bacterium]MCB9021589.1 hypothetical protein [Chitinophagales bacterium]MCB9031158.1 hypothetical protein [Chitinophagales bacterium]HAE34536.1 hypothetical protein [Bacteroidota bacterium]